VSVLEKKMNKFLISAFIVTAIAGGWQFRVAAHPGHDHGAEPAVETPTGTPTEAPGTDDHQNSMVEVPDNQPLPTVKLIAHPDSRQGWNLEVQTTNFQFAPEHVDQLSQATAEQPLEGHAHLYIDGVKITRFYANWYYLESLAPGKHEITVALNTNDHNMLMHNGQPIQSTVVIDVPVAVR
jgi:hypothetical protein